MLAAPKYQGVFKSVWLWKDWPGCWGADKGIDLVAQTVAGKLWAIQAKAVRSDRAIPKSELDSFLSESNRPQFDYRLIIATTDDIGRNARETLAGQVIMACGKIPTLDLGGDNKRQVQWDQRNACAAR